MKTFQTLIKGCSLSEVQCIHMKMYKIALDDDTASHVPFKDQLEDPNEEQQLFVPGTAQIYQKNTDSTAKL